MKGRAKDESIFNSRSGYRVYWNKYWFDKRSYK